MPTLVEIADGETQKTLSKALESFKDKWTTAPPTEPGWYWFWLGDGDPVAPIVMHVTRHAGNGKLYVRVQGVRYSLEETEMHPSWKWLGPIPMPEPPKD